MTRRDDEERWWRRGAHLWWRWVMATTVPLVVLKVLTFGLLTYALAFLQIVSYPLLWGTILAAQWWVLRRSIPNARAWLVVGLVGLGLGTALDYLVVLRLVLMVIPPLPLPEHPLWAVLGVPFLFGTQFALVGVSIAAFQWQALRHVVPPHRAGSLSWVLAGGVGAAMLGAVLATDALGAELWGRTSGWLLLTPVANGVTGAVGGIAYGVPTGSALVWLLHGRRGPSAPSTGSMQD